MHDDTQPFSDTVPPIEIDDIIAHLAAQQAHFGSYLDRHWDDLDVRRLVRLLSLYGQNATRLGRLLRDRCVIHGPEYDEQIAWLDETWEKLRAKQGIEPVDHDEDTPTDGDSVSHQPPVHIDDVITDLADRQARLSQYLDRHWNDPQVEHFDRLLAVFSHNASRLGRLLRDRCAIYGPPPDLFEVLTHQALVQLSEERGIDLINPR